MNARASVLAQYESMLERARRRPAPALPKGWELTATARPRIRRGQEHAFEVPTARFVAFASGSSDAKAHIATTQRIQAEIQRVRGSQFLPPFESKPHRDDPTTEKHDAPMVQPQPPASGATRCSTCQHERREHLPGNGMCKHLSCACRQFTETTAQRPNAMPPNDSPKPSERAITLSARDVERARRAGISPDELLAALRRQGTGR